MNAVSAVRLRRKHEIATAPSVVQRLFTDAIAAERQRSRLLVPQREGQHGLNRSIQRRRLKPPCVRYDFRANATYWAPSGSQPSLLSIGRSKENPRGKKRLYRIRGDAQPASSNCRARSRAKISLALASKGQVFTAWTVRGFKGLCSNTAIRPPRLVIRC